MHRIVHVMSWTQLGCAASAAVARTTTEGIQSFSRSTTTVNLLFLLENQTKVVLSPLLRWGLSHRRQWSARVTSTWQEHERCRSAKPNFPVPSKIHRNAYHLKQRHTRTDGQLLSPWTVKRSSASPLDGRRPVHMVQRCSAARSMCISIAPTVGDR